MENCLLAQTSANLRGEVEEGASLVLSFPRALMLDAPERARKSEVRLTEALVLADCGTAVHADDLTVDPFAVVRHQIGDHGGDIVRTAKPGAALTLEHGGPERLIDALLDSVGEY